MDCLRSIIVFCMLFLVVVCHSPLLHPRLKRSAELLGQEAVHLTRRFSGSVISPGASVTLECAMSGGTGQRIVWERDGTIITPNTDSRYILEWWDDANGSASRVNVTRALKEDGGLWSCRAGTNRHEARIDVFGPPYIRAVPPLWAPAGQPLELRCPYYGYPVREITWEFRGQEITTEIPTQISRFERSVEEINNKHSKSRLNLQDKNRYFDQISLQNRLSLDSAYLSKDLGTNLIQNLVNANTVFRKKRQTVTVSSDGTLHIPEVTKSDNGAVFACTVRSPAGELARRAFSVTVVEPPVLEDIHLPSDLREGQMVQIHCNLRSGDQPVYFSWLKDSQKIPPELKIVERNVEEFSSLVVRNASLQHAGHYSCRAANRAATARVDVTLHVRAPPRWVVEPQNASLIAGRPATLPCEAIGYPQPTITWLKKDEITSTWREVPTAVRETDSMSTLTWSAVTSADAGLYTCSADNAVGTPLVKSVSVTVRRPVSFNLPSRNVTATRGQDVTLECLPRGDPPIRVVWTYEGRPVDPVAQRMSISEERREDGLRSLLRVTSAEGGAYTCRAHNPHGVATHSVMLRVLEPPRPPSGVAAQATSGGVRVSWRDDVTHAGDVTYSVLVAGRPPIPCNHTSIENGRVWCTLVGLRPGMTYTARVAVHTSLGDSPASAPVTFTTPEEAPRAPPADVVATPGNSRGVVLVSWLSAPRVSAYRVRAIPHPDTDTDTDAEEKVERLIAASDGGRQQTELRLRGGVRYLVSVAAVSAGGEGPASTPQLVLTPEGAPESPPRDVHCLPLSSSALRVSWSPLTALSPLTYTLLATAPDGRVYTGRSTGTETTIDSVSAHTQYSVRVRGETARGAGPPSPPVHCATLEDVPGPPSAVKLVPSSGTSLLLCWSPPVNTNGQLTHYTLYYKPADSDEPPTSQRVGVEETSLEEVSGGGQCGEVRGVRPGRGVEVWVRASTRAGQGPPSSVATATPKDRVVAGVGAVGGAITAASGRRVRLWCRAAGVPPPRVVWYHRRVIITHHPRYELLADHSLLIHDIDSSLGGNYTCLAKNLLGSDAVTYIVTVRPRPPPPALRISPRRRALLVQWLAPDPAFNYNITWRERDGPWNVLWTGRVTSGSGNAEVGGLRCGATYTVRAEVSDDAGTNASTQQDVTTLGHPPIPSEDDELWLWSNSSHIRIDRNGWQDGGCDVTRWELEYRPVGSGGWQAALIGVGARDVLWLGPLPAARWWQIRLTAHNDAGAASDIYVYPTKTVDGETPTGPHEGAGRVQLLAALLAGCAALTLLVLVALVKVLTPRDSARREREDKPCSPSPHHVYASPRHSKQELCEVGPYAEFALGFRAVEPADNTAPAPIARPRSRHPGVCVVETRLARSDSDDSDVPRAPRGPHRGCRR